MLKSLIKVQLKGLLNMMLNNRSSKTQKQSVGGKIAFICIMFGVFLLSFGTSFFGVFLAIGSSYAKTNEMWAFFSLYFVLCFAMIIIGSVFITKYLLFESKDNDLLLSLPIPPKYILFSRMLIILIYNYIFSLIVSIPAFLAYFVSGAATFGGFICFFVIAILLPLFSMSITSVLAWVLSIIGSKIKRKSLITTVFYVIIFVGYLFCCTKMGTAISAVFENPDMIGSGLKKVLPLYWFGISLAQPNFLYFMAFVILFAGSFALAYYILSKTFIKTITTKRGFKKIAYKEKEAKQGSQIGALLKRDLNRLGSSPTYMMNACLGALFSLVFGGFLIFASFKDIIPFDIFKEIMPSLDIMPIALAAFIVASCMLSAMTMVTAPSISIEGKALWILQSIPCSEKKIFNSKILTHLVITIPTSIIVSIGLCMLFKPTGLMLVISLVLPSLFNIFVAVLGLVESIRHPMLNWTNEAVAVKSGFSVLFTMLISSAVLIIPVILYLSTMIILPNPVWALLFFTIIISAFTALLYLYLCKGGAKKFRELS